MTKKQLRKVLVAIKKKIERVVADEECVDIQLLEILDELKYERIKIWGMIEKLDLG